MATIQANAADPGALLLLGNYGGTLAAARCLGERGVDVVLADSTPLSVARASRYVRNFERAPPLTPGSGFVDWLIEMARRGGRGKRGARFRDRVLFPASDESLFVIAKYRADLSEWYRLYIPPFESIYKILNKQLLYAACSRAGVAYPRTWYPEDAAQAREILADAAEPVMIKPKTQAQLPSGSKGIVVAPQVDGVGGYLRFMRNNNYGTDLLRYDPAVAWPMIQSYHSSARHPVYAIAGFMDGSGRAPLARGSRKVLQRPRNMGIGIGFEAADVDPTLLVRIEALCRDLGYEGIFDVEFIGVDGEWLLIDFNGRTYGQMAFEVARGLPAPYLHYLAAVGDTLRYEEEYARAAHWRPAGGEAYGHARLIEIIAMGQRTWELLSGCPSEHWDRWLDSRNGRLTDAVRWRGDPGPSMIDIVRHATDFMRHPRSFVHSLRR